jgi:hypothetical protein
MAPLKYRPPPFRPDAGPARVPVNLVEFVVPANIHVVAHSDDATPLADEVAARYIAWHDWRHNGKTGPQPVSDALPTWEKWITTDPERAWAVVLAIVQLRPTDDEILEQVWYRVQQFLRRYGSAYHARTLALVGRTARLARIARPTELDLAYYRPPPLDIPKLVETWFLNYQSIRGWSEFETLIKEEPVAAWPLVLEIVHRGPLHGLTAFDTMSPLLRLLRRHGPMVIDRLEDSARDSVLLRRCLWRMRAQQSTTPTEDDIAPDVWPRIASAARGTTDYNSEDVPANPRALLPEQEQLVDAWFAHTATFWAWERVNDLVRNDPEIGWRVITRLVDQAPSDGALGSIGAGALEDLLSSHGEHFIDRVEAAARNGVHFRITLAGVWQAGMSPAIWERVMAARGPAWE